MSKEKAFIETLHADGSDRFYFQNPTHTSFPVKPNLKS